MTERISSGVFEIDLSNRYTLSMFIENLNTASKTTGLAISRIEANYQLMSGLSVSLRIPPEDEKGKKINFSACMGHTIKDVASIDSKSPNGIYVLESSNEKYIIYLSQYGGGGESDSRTYELVHIWAINSDTEIVPDQDLYYNAELQFSHDTSSYEGSLGGILESQNAKMKMLGENRFLEEFARLQAALFIPVIEKTSP